MSTSDEFDYLLVLQVTDADENGIKGKFPH